MLSSSLKMQPMIPSTQHHLWIAGQQQDDWKLLACQLENLLTKTHPSEGGGRKMKSGVSTQASYVKTTTMWKDMRTVSWIIHHSNEWDPSHAYSDRCNTFLWLKSVFHQICSGNLQLFAVNTSRFCRKCSVWIMREKWACCLITKNFMLKVT